MGGIKALIVLPVAAFHLAIVSGCIGTYQFMPYPMFLKAKLEKGGPVRSAVGTEPLGKLLPIICLDTLNGTWESLQQMFQELC